jgi:glutamine---fructose-6-phosphate transaminase (isomerizing)
VCGIVGYIGNEDVKEVLLKGLERLEYRGYDSSGIGILTEKGQVSVFKDLGRVEHLRKIIDQDVLAHLGIGHTRWSTHGEPSKINAHPHQSNSKRFTIVHNGVIENEDHLRETYFSNYQFVSETDTEVIVELIDFYVEEYKDLELAIRHLMHHLHGSYALGIIDNQEPDKLYVVKNKSPLLIGLGDDFNMIGSDAMAMINKTNRFCELNDQEYAILTRDSVSIFEITGAQVTRDYFETNIDKNEVDKGTYPHYMLKEIDEQAFVIRRILEKYTDERHEKFNVDKNIIKAIKDADHLYIVAAGTSYHAGLVGKQLFEKLVHIPVDVCIASEFVYNQPVLSKKPLFIFISQSGETADSRAVLVNVNKMGYPSLAITNVENSTLYRESTYNLLLHAGPEIAVASTKAYTAQIAVLAICAYIVSETTEFDMVHELSIVANVIESICDRKDDLKELAHQYLSETRNCFYIGRHIDYTVAMEASLKLKEISYIQTEGFAAGELKHGTIALIEKNTPVIAIISQEEINLNTRSNVKEVKSRGANALVISLRSISSEQDGFVIDDVYRLLTPLVTVVPTQILAYYAALERGLDIDKPRNLAKSVTVE